MKMSELKQLSSTELTSQLLQSRQEYYGWLESVMTGKEKNYKKLNKLRRNVARLKTALASSTPVSSK